VFRRKLKAGIGLAAVFALCAPAAAGAKDALRVGAVESLTGPVATAGIPNGCGLQIAADYINEHGVMSKYDLELVIEDDQSKPAVAAQAASKLTGDDITLFVGGTSTSTVLAQLPILKDAGAFYTGGTTKADQVFDSDALVIRLNSNAAQDGAVIADYVAKTLGAKKIAFVALQGAYADGVLKSISMALPAESKIVDPFIVPADTTNFQSVITSLAASDFDAVILGTFGQTQTVAFLRQYKQAGVQKPLVMGSGLLFPGVAKAAGGAAEGVVSADLWTDAIANPANDVLKAAFEKYKDKHALCKDLPLDKQIAITFSQVLLLAQAIEKSDSVDPETLRKTVMETEWELPQGKVQFDERGQAKVTYTLIVAKGDTTVPLK